MTSLSVWWPTPYRPSRWFDDEALAASARYHRPLRRAAFSRLALQLALIGLGQWWLLTRTAAADELSGEASTWILGAVIVAVGWWAPAALVDAWFEFRHEPRFGHRPLPRGQFAVGSFVTLVAAVAVALGVAFAVRFLVDQAPGRWWLILGLVVAAALVIVGGLGAAASRVGHRIEPLDDEVVGAIGEELGLDVSYGRMRSDAIVGLNALTIGWRHVDVVVTDDLLAEPAELQQHVVAHELSHVRHRDTMTSLLATAVADGLAIGAVAASVPVADIADGRRLPMLLVAAAAAAGIANIVLAWLSRAHERRADLDAHRLVGPTPEWALRRLHLTDRADLAPPWWARLVASHPSPGERLELARVVRER